ncbi:hypothetical protein [Levilactobacillus tongjiangensis]|uniref:Uncharacterized protein n=1 Tax=Levilactobacillus tongjiangensis TaxID=2486023 RepID=A0ABW1SRA6_9LACO|nr:hypothetical protein [Levilactobacillus tongjiangensis]
MMRKKTLFVAILLAAASIGGMVGTTPTTVHAKTRSLTTFPKRYRHTWYHYIGHGKYDTQKFTAKTWQYTSHAGGYVKVKSSLHPTSTYPYQHKEHSSWVFGSTIFARKAHWINIKLWNQNAGYGDYYKTSTKKYHGKKISTLSAASGLVQTSDHYYRSKKVAKQLKNHHFKGEVYEH